MNVKQNLRYHRHDIIGFFFLYDSLVPYKGVRGALNSITLFCSYSAALDFTFAIAFRKAEFEDSIPIYEAALHPGGKLENDST